ncbi:MAG: hypothetical protein K1X54_11065, partial [Flavobacteriales bacterium]|nr:hypothetical protein [Flavobacteriales bacterium]
TELIQNYIHEQQDFLSSVMAKQPQSSNLMKPLSDCAGYYKAQVKENMSLFTDRTRLETLLIKHLRSMDAKAFITSLPIAAVQNVASSAMKSESGSLLTIDELLENAPQVTKEELTSLNEYNKKSPESAQQVAPHEISSDSTLTIKGTSLHDTASDSSFTKREILKPKGSNHIGLNPLKTKRPIDRFKVNCNFQLDPSTRFFPSSGMLSLGLAYQYLPSGCVGMSFTYNQPLPKRVFSSENREIMPVGKGYGMRTFVDYRLKGNLFIMAGYDFGLRSEIQSNKKNQTDLVHYQSALMGLKVRYSSKKSRGQPTMEILYDFLHGKTGQPAVVTRFGFDIVRKHGLR